MQIVSLGRGGLGWQWLEVPDEVVSSVWESSAGAKNASFASSQMAIANLSRKHRKFIWGDLMEEGKVEAHERRCGFACTRWDERSQKHKLERWGFGTGSFWNRLHPWEAAAQLSWLFCSSIRGILNISSRKRLVVAPVFPSLGLNLCSGSASVSESTINSFAFCYKINSFGFQSFLVSQVSWRNSGKPFN